MLRHRLPRVSAIGFEYWAILQELWRNIYRRPIYLSSAAAASVNACKGCHPGVAVSQVSQIHRSANDPFALSFWPDGVTSFISVYLVILMTLSIL